MTAQSHPGWTEADRLAALDSYAILDTPAEKTFDDIVKLVCLLTDASIAAVNLIADKRQWFKSEIGLGVQETPLDNSICKFALLQGDSIVIPDTLDDPRTNCNPLVTGEPGLRFYAGELLKTPDGLPLGTLCVLDTKPRPEGLTSQQEFALKTLAQQVLALIELHRIVHNQQAALTEKERLEAEAYAGRERFEKLVNQAATGIVETDRSTCITLVNQKMCEMLGYTEAEMIAMTVSDITHSASLPQTKALANKLATGSASQIIEKQYVRKDGSLMWATSSVNALRTKDGQFQGLVANIVDVTERKQAENALRISEERFRSLVTSVSQMVWTTGAHGQVIEDSPSWREFTGQSYDGYQGVGWLDAVHPDDRKNAVKVWENSTTGKTIYTNEFRVRRADGEYRWTAVRAVPLFNEDGIVGEWIGTNTDITDARQAQDAIRASEERLHFALQAGSMAAWDWNLVTGRTIRSNMSSLVPGLVTGQADDFFNLIHPDDREQLLQGIEQAKTGEVPYDFEFRVISPDGQVIWLADKAQLRVDPSDGQMHLTGVSMDITARKLAETERQQFVSLAEHSNEFIGMADANLTPYFINSAGVKMVGLESAQQALSMQIKDFFFPEDQAFILNEFLPRAMENGTDEVEIRFRHFKSGEAIWMIYSVYVVRNERGNVIGHATVSRNITDRKYAEQKLSETAQRLQFTLEAAHVGDWQYDLITGSNYRSLQHDECFGYTEPVPEWSIEKFFEHVHPEDQEPTREKFEAALRALNGWHLECRVIWPDSSVHWIAVHGSLHTEYGVPTRALGIIYDVTERMAGEAALRDAQVRLEANLNAGEVSTWVFDIRSNRMFADRNLAELFAVSEADANGGRLEAYLKAIHPDDLEEVSLLVQKAIETGKPYQASYRVRNTAGGWRFVVARGKVEYDQNGLPLHMAGVILDVTRQKLIEKELLAKEERYGALFNAIDEGFCIIEVLFDTAGNPVDYRFIEANPAFAKHSGLANAVGKTVRELVPNFEQRWIDLYSQVAMSGEPIRLVDHSLSLSRWFDVHASKVGDSHSRRVAVLFNDITGQRHNEENLRKLAADLSESNRRKTEFLATLAHELRNPLAPIRTGLDLLRVGQDTQATVARVREMMGRQVDHMTHLVNDLLDVARINSGKVELRKTRVELKAIVSSAVETSMPLVKAKQHELLVDLPDKALWLDADLTRLAQVLGNLLSNAAKYTPNNGHITLTACEDNTDEVVISVTDSGIGIPAESLPDVFDMFTQIGRNMPHAQGGLGIGLSLVRRLVELHEGTVTVTSAGLRQGSKFTVRLPLIGSSGTQDVEATAMEKERDLSGERQLRILVVDDNIDAVGILAELLEMFGHSVRASNDGREALEIAKTFRPDLVMLDLGMPGMTGYEVARAMRKTPETQQTILAAITGWGAQEDRARTREAGFDHHLTKPVDMKALKKLLSFILDTLID
jgi:PAS domain S-box-containing protein